MKLNDDVDVLDIFDKSERAQDVDDAACTQRLDISTYTSAASEQVQIIVAMTKPVQHQDNPTSDPTLMLNLLAEEGRRQRPRRPAGLEAG